MAWSCVELNDATLPIAASSRSTRSTCATRSSEAGLTSTTALSLVSSPVAAVSRSSMRVDSDDGSVALYGPSRSATPAPSTPATTAQTSAIPTTRLGARDANRARRSSMIVHLRRELALVVRQPLRAEAVQREAVAQRGVRAAAGLARARPDRARPGHALLVTRAHRPHIREPVLGGHAVGEEDL